jgi:hypothetical protein
MKISELIKQLEKIQQEEGDLYVTNSNYDIKEEPLVYVSKPEDDEKSPVLNAEKAAAENKVKFEIEKAKSIILQYCSENKNGFSLNRNG